MKQISKPWAISAVLVGSLFLSGCSLVAQPADVATETPTTSITGKVTVAGSLISILANGKSTEITSRKMDLKQYDGQTVTVTGEFSGTTLFVDTIK